MSWTWTTMPLLLQFSFSPPPFLLCLSFSPLLSPSHCFHHNYLVLKVITGSIWLYKLKVIGKLVIQLMSYLVKILWIITISWILLCGVLKSQSKFFSSFLQTVSNHVHAHKGFLLFDISYVHKIYLHHAHTSVLLSACAIVSPFQLHKNCRK